MAAIHDREPLVLFGRSSSHFTRVAQMFARELGIAYELRVIRDLLSLEPGDYGGNPALKLPTLSTEAGKVFGALNICRELFRRSEAGLTVLWPEQLESPVAASAQELVVHAMGTEVTLIMAERGGSPAGTAHHRKLERSLQNTLAWLEANLPGVIRDLPARDLSYLEVTAFSLMRHLAWREVLDTTHYVALTEFCAVFGERRSARDTEFRFDS